MELAVLLQATLPGAPCTFYGGEIGLQGGIDPDSRRAFPWDEGRWDAELLASVRASFALRRAEPALRADGVDVLATAGAALLFERRSGDRRLAVALNAGDEPATLPLGADTPNGAATVLLAVGRARSEAPRTVTGDHGPAIRLAARSGAVIALA
jgi:neopullulanase